MERSLPAWITAKRLNMPNEEKQLFRYITHNCDEISKTESFYELDATQLKEIQRANIFKAEECVQQRTRCALSCVNLLLREAGRKKEFFIHLVF
ncbi:hypothetical protein MTO96_010025 [Rhipicephalus appendiculatus]